MSAQSHWLSLLRRYLLASMAGNLVWEIVQLPLYTIWKTGTSKELVVAVLHCTLGDVAIATSALVVGLVMVGSNDWPARSFRAVAIAAVLIGLGYTVYSERTNVLIRRSWDYSEWMPVLPWLGVGLSPVLQWLIVPPVALAFARRRRHSRSKQRASNS